MNYLGTFTTFTPRIMFPESMLKTLKKSYAKTGLLVCGELHGVKENAEIIYSLVSFLGCETLSIERKYEEVGAFIESAVNGNPNFDLVNKDVFTSSMFSVEMAKTIVILLKKGLIKQIVYIDGDDEDTEAMLARNLAGIQHHTIAVMGNWHTVRDIYEDGTEKHISALRLLRQSRDVTSLEYHYEMGSYYNAGTGLDSFENEPGELRIENSRDDFNLFLPHVHAIAH